MIADFLGWIEQGGEFALGFAAVVGSLTASIFGLIKVYNHFMQPHYDAKQASEEGDKKLHGRIDKLEAESKQCAKKFANDDEAIKSLRREQNRQAETLAMLTEGVFLVIQHLVTEDHVEDMQEWMREYTKQNVKSDIKS